MIILGEGKLAHSEQRSPLRQPLAGGNREVHRLPQRLACLIKFVLPHLSDAYALQGISFTNEIADVVAHPQR